MADIIAFPGPHSDLFADYIRFKRSLGYAIADSYQYVLREIARCIISREPDPEIVSAATAEELTARRPHESTSTQCKRITIVRQFCLWLASTGYSPTIPAQGLVRDTTEFVPRIVSESEMARIITIADRDEPHQRRLLLRLLWCCGMRIGEACRLAVSDIDPSAGTILIAHAKGDRTRLVPMSASLADYVGTYLDWTNSTGAEGSARPLMPTRNNTFPRSGQAGTALSRIFARAGVLTSQGRSIRPHDLRHSYAVHALENMVETGMDVYATLPLLAAFMGHADITSTEYYLRFTQDTLCRIVDAQQPTSHRVFKGQS
ncbi:MAG: tyrosine-type recombinase/integrase [Brevibacterium sp.]|uniref:tyrosine-type recombinase/integrase n=1 Tax=Brevibacterium sp. TaxID=1701 RepID=UPI002647EA53|nr:tyrosine-type recombinase/integrase [Brevibacterium sp.]MDN5833237.1 tyrosine-type recombinase/integrase [Brevibacterium sp.]MDN5875859.1 tyrosine-type recombinase/integrase [Brevibacterium sp.]MDN5908198.1 tyrosine-type recombinase/integrase [Brevibacterium sp.]MDN6122247.1 tyrosine-type recombinase/integrase [Brevibacterium sp.]MDN6132822.1 tyrosine-type recombinase/integrase [Brevibacterium sp.]